jgi:DNA polymerase sigma
MFSHMLFLEMISSPMSDLDMCLQIPDGALITTEDDPTGANSMAKLAQMLEQNGMKEVDTSRLTARIPVIKFNCPKPLEDGAEEEDALMECDLSMHNPLAVLNTGLLRSYAEINPVSRVLASVIKRWAKARDINNPARHTLSSYGYILMLLHFLTFHERSGNGLVSPLDERKSDPTQVMPLLPNLQWMDGAWPSTNPGTPYKEYASMPKNQIKHPLEERAIVNMHYYRPNAAMLSNLQRLFPGQDLSLGILLASFFRYYAFEFDYKRHVVSLHSNSSHGIVEREIKAELDGWRNYSAALTIEDPFETFYDVAHVLRGGYYHRIRREFALGYSKIADIAAGKISSTWGNKTVDLTKMTGLELVDWICEPIANEKEEAPTS